MSVAERVEPKLFGDLKPEPEPKINNFGSATLVKIQKDNETRQTEKRGKKDRGTMNNILVHLRIS